MFPCFVLFLYLNVTENASSSSSHTHTQPSSGPEVVWLLLWKTSTFGPSCPHCARPATRWIELYRLSEYQTPQLTPTYPLQQQTSRGSQCVRSVGVWCHSAIKWTAGEPLERVDGDRWRCDGGITLVPHGKGSGRNAKHSACTANILPDKGLSESFHALAQSVVFKAAVFLHIAGWPQ